MTKPATTLEAADIAAILKALPQLGGSLEVLPTSWRSRSELVKLVNAIFGHAFTKSLPEAEIALTSTRNDRLPGAPIANWILGGRNTGLEASALAAGIRRLVQTRYQVIDKGAIAPRDVSFGDIAVLSRSNDGVKVITAALRAQGIPSATSQPGLLAAPEVTLALACLRRLNDPSDTIATAEILSLADCLEPEEWVADRLQYLQSGADADGWMEVATSEHEAHPLIAKLGKMRHSLPLLAPREALQTVIAECGLASKVLRWAPDADVARVRLANLEALQELAAQYEDLCRAGQHAASTSGLILWLRELVAEEKDLLAEPGIDAVKVMTHHAAKGLEWPVVVLTDLATDTRDRLWSISAQSSAGLEVQAPLAGRWIRYWLWPFGAQQRVGVADAIGLTPIAEAFRDSAIEESKRLLYVSMTRARDHLVFARSSRRLTGEWLNCVEAPWLLPEEGREEITLPSGEKVPAICWALDPIVETGAAMERAVIPLHWFQTITDKPSRLPLIFNPSSAEKSACEALEKVRIGDRIPVVDGTDMSLLGSALHACIAASFTDDAAPLSHDEVEKTLRAFGVSECVSAAAVLRQISALRAWIAERWGKVTPFAEYPVQSVLDSGQTLNGRIDLLLQTSDGWVLIDHKSSPGRSENWDNLAREYGSQLAAYGRAVEKASGRPVIEAWLYLPVAAGGVRVSDVR